MVLNLRQQIATAFLAVLIVASVIAMPRSFEPQARTGTRASGSVAAAPAVTAELSHDQVKDLTYN